MKIFRTITTILTIVGLTLALASGAQANEGFYVGGAIGKGYLDENIDGIRIDTDSSTYRIYGGYGFTRYFGVEAAYLDLGTFRETIDVGGVDVPVSASAAGFSLAAVGTLPLSERFSALARLGYYFHDGESSAAGIAEDSPSEKSPFIGIGLAYDLSEVLEVNVGIDYIDTDDADPTLATLGLTLRF
jgi:OOP family OmpA-OmpF porin